MHLHAKSDEFMRMKARSGLLVGPAMPFWFDSIEDVGWKGQRRKLKECVQEIYDYVAIMHYRNTADGPEGIVSHAQSELDNAYRMDNKDMIGIETLETSLAKVSFFGKGGKYFKEQLAMAGSAMAQYRSFGGFVVHHLKSYRVLVDELKK